MPLSELLASRVQDYFCGNQYDEAIAYLRGVLESAETTNQERAEANKLLGRIRYYQHDFRSAKDLFRAACAHDPDDVYALFYLAHCLTFLGDPQSALRLYAVCMERAKHTEGIGDHLSERARCVPFGDPGMASLATPRSLAPDQKAECRVRVSVIILCYNKLEYTIKCLSSLFANTDYSPLEVIVVDNASVDDTPGYLEMFSKRVKFLHSSTNLGFVGGNNFAVGHATGEVLVFLNNDTEVQRGWLSEMLRCMALHPEAGAVGARLLYPNKTVQEGGGIIFSDGNGWNYGRTYPPNSSLVSFVREVDYCSGAALMVRADLFRSLAGFDTRYAPAYCEDSDLCFSVRALGYKVLYCPSAVVLHHEGVTSGTDVARGFKKFQEINVPKFRTKWAQQLALQSPNEPLEVYRASRRGRRQSVLIMDDWPPLPDKASGTLRMYTTVKEMVALGWHVTYAHLVGANLGPTAEGYLKELRNLGVEFVWLEYEKWWTLRHSPEVQPILRQILSGLDVKTRKPDFVYMSFWFVADYFLEMVREALPETPIIIDTHDLHYLRETRQAELLHDKKLLKEAQANKRRELATYAKADCITTVTEEDRQALLKDLPGKPVFIMTNIHEAAPSSVPFSERKDLLFVGNFNHNPNQDAVLFFVEKIFPAIRASLPEVRLLIVGNNPSENIRSLACADIEVTGWVPSLQEYFDRCRLSVVPLRYGAGVKGKVGEAIAHGLPCVLTTVAAEGMNIVDGEQGLIADDPRDFAGAVVRLYNDEILWNHLVTYGADLVQKQYSAEATRKRLKYITSFTTRQSLTSSRALRYPTPPEVSIILVTFNQIEYTRQCLDSIRQHTAVSHEIVIIDNGSSDGTIDVLRRYPEVRVIRNCDNRGFPAAVNQGLVAATGNHMLLLNNDAIVTEGWLQRMLDVARREKGIGIVGPMSNRISGAQCDPEAHYATIDEMHAYARTAATRKTGRVQIVPRVAFFCTLITREVLEVLGGVDERFTPGNFEDDDYCLRANMAGFRTVIAHDVFVHHFGSKSFLVNGQAHYNDRLEKNLAIFIEKWGASPEALWTCQKSPVKRRLRIPLSDNEFLKWFDRTRAAIDESSLTAAFEYIARSIAHYHDVDGMGPIVRFDDLLILGGSIALRVGRPEVAGQWYQEALALTPHAPIALTGLGQVHMATGHHAQARQMFEQALAADPEHRAAKEGMCEVKTLGAPSPMSIDERLTAAQQHFNNGDFEKALGTLVPIENELGSMEDEQQRVEFTSAVENFRGVCHLSLRRLDAAKSHFERSLHINPGSSRACAGLGEVFFLANQLDAAKTMFEWAVRNDPHSGAAREGLAQANAALGIDREHNSLLLEVGEMMADPGNHSGEPVPQTSEGRTTYGD